MRRYALPLALAALALSASVAYARPVQLLQKNLIGDSSLVSYWNFNAGSSADYKGANNGTDNHATYGTQYGMFGQGVTGTTAGNSSIAMSASGFPTGSAAITVAAWVNQPAAGFADVMKYGGTSGGPTNGWRDFDIQTDLYFQGYANDVDSGLTMPTGTWTFVAWVYSAGSGSMTFYVNSASTTKSLPSGALNTVGGNGFIGAQDGNLILNMIKIDDLQVYSRALSDAEIRHLYTSRSVQENGISR